MRAHEVPTTQVLYCGKCHAGICFAHILEAYGVHAAEALLRYAKDADQNAWHERHTHVDPRRPLLLGERRHAGPPPLARRMAWVASTFRRCRPLCLARVGVGFYDEVEVAVAVAVRCFLFVVYLVVLRWRCRLCQRLRRCVPSGTRFGRPVRLLRSL